MPAAKRVDERRMPVMAELKYEITAQIGVLSERSGWTKELNMIRWNDREPKYDIRDWSPDKAK